MVSCYGFQVLNEIYSGHQAKAHAERYLHIIKDAMTIPKTRKDAFPLTYYQLAKYVDLNELLPTLYCIDACPSDNECMLFRNEHKDATECPICGAARYNDSGLPRRTAYYFHLKEILQKMFANPQKAKWMHYATERYNGFFHLILCFYMRLMLLMSAFYFFSIICDESV